MEASTRRDGAHDWKQSIRSIAMRPLLWQEMNAALNAAGFQSMEYFGDMAGTQFNPDTSDNLVVKARVLEKKEGRDRK